MSQIDMSEKLSQKPGTSLFAICGLGVAAIAMIAWICALAWGAWRVLNWLLF